MTEKKVNPEKPAKKIRMSKAQFVKQAGISHLNSREKQKRYLEYIR